MKGLELRRKLREFQEIEISRINHERDTEIIPACLCGEPAPTTGSLMRDGFHYGLCPRCGLIFQLNPLITDVLYNSCSSSVSESFWLDVLEAQADSDLERYESILDRIGSAPGNGEGPRRKILDVGCSSGLFLQAALARGWVPEGIELNPLAAIKARDRGIRVHNIPVEKFFCAQARFRAVTLLEVLEHLKDPVGTLNAVRGLLIPHGILALVVPNGGALALRALRDRCTMLGRDHLWLFNPHNLQRTVENAGFIQLSSETIFPALDAIELALELEPEPQLSDRVGSFLPSESKGLIERWILDHGLGYKIQALFRKA